MISFNWPQLKSILGLSLLVLVVGYSLFVKPYVTLWMAFKDKEAHLKAEFYSKQRLASSTNAQSESFNALQRQFQVLLQDLPSHTQMPRVLEELSNASKEQGLKLIHFAPQKELKHDFYVELPIKMTIEGTYFQLAGFVSFVSDTHRMISFEELVIEESTTFALTKSLLMTTTAKLYRQRTV